MSSSSDQDGVVVRDLTETTMAFSIVLRSCPLYFRVLAGMMSGFNFQGEEDKFKAYK